MKKGWVMIVVVVFVALLFWFFAGRQSVAPIVDTNSWQTFATSAATTYAPHYGGVTFVRNGFTFRYPNAWTVGYGNPAAIMSLYDGEVSANLAECLKRRAALPANLINPPVGACDDPLHAPSITIFPDAYVDYAALDPDLKGNYPQYEKLAVPGLDAFKYVPNSDVPEIAYHVNFPDRKTGIEFQYDSNGPRDYATDLSAILGTFRFLP